MQQAHLFPMIRNEVTVLLNNYVRADEISKHMNQYIVPPGLKNQAGVMGAIALARFGMNDAPK